MTDLYCLVCKDKCHVPTHQEYLKANEVEAYWHERKGWIDNIISSHIYHKEEAYAIYSEIGLKHQQAVERCGKAYNDFHEAPFTWTVGPAGHWTLLWGAPDDTAEREFLNGSPEFFDGSKEEMIKNYLRGLLPAHHTNWRYDIRPRFEVWYERPRWENGKIPAQVLGQHLVVAGHWEEPTSLCRTLVASNSYTWKYVQDHIGYTTCRTCVDKAQELIDAAIANLVIKED